MFKIHLVRPTERDSTLTVKELVAITKQFMPGVFVTARRAIRLLKRRTDVMYGEQRGIGFVCVNSESRHRHLSVVVIQEDGKAKLTCDCEMFKFHCEVALYARGVAHIVYSNGGPPLKTNPSMIPYLCPHLLVAIAGLTEVDMKGTVLPPQIQEGKKGVGIKVDKIKTLK